MPAIISSLTALLLSIRNVEGFPVHGFLVRTVAWPSRGLTLSPGEVRDLGDVSPQTPTTYRLKRFSITSRSRVIESAFQATRLIIGLFIAGILFTLIKSRACVRGSVVSGTDTKLTITFMPKTVVNGRTFHFEESGQQGAPLVFLSGLGGITGHSAGPCAISGRDFASGV